MFAGSKKDHAIRSRAYALAETGRFTVVREVEQALVSEGWPDARSVLQGEYVRQAVAERLAVHAHQYRHARK